MVAKYWLKLYHEMLDDPKVMTLRPSLRWRFIETLLMAGEMDEDGYLPDLKHYAWRVRDTLELVESELIELADAGLLSREDGRWLVTRFAERQAPVSAAERMRQMRLRQQKDEYYEGDTPSLQDGYEPVTKRNTEKRRIDTDTEDNGASSSFELYEQNIGIITPLIADQIKDWDKTYPDGWVGEAIKIAVEQNVRKPKYIDAILKNWEKDGKQTKGNVPATQPKEVWT